jgi:hypothetical protein
MFGFDALFLAGLRLPVFDRSGSPRFSFEFALNLNLCALGPFVLTSPPLSIALDFTPHR